MKRIFDFVICGVVLTLLSPLLLLSVIMIKLTSKGPVFFLQERLGKNGQLFQVYKFRTMTDEVRRFDVQVYNSDSEVTLFGKFARRLKIDELPQLLNVLKGDMSIVGPRPCLPSLQKEFNEDGQARLLVRPGLTGLAQVNGNIYLSWEERWKLDRQYVENQSLLLDLKIILRTVAVVFLGEKWGKKA
ncbi:sugar transferase [Pseudoalteromonas piscicida]|uniref:Sugar transferase n=1 Tax=Pseudoalteromonas piscicida TaxID=43662 RepID=A0AAD0RHA3_PSEO7|nr:sugar transferase [Pseudoalteromonas piscicida]ASD68095.1 sugar transferase [Pseudoalteromonas piscicida]AXR01196.1 sugar transferase [Pseudoalteromonas piscicida]